MNVHLQGYCPYCTMYNKVFLGTRFIAFFKIYNLPINNKYNIELVMIRDYDILMYAIPALQAIGLLWL